MDWYDYKMLALLKKKYPSFHKFIKEFPFREEMGIPSRYGNSENKELLWFSNYMARVARYKNVKIPIISTNIHEASSLSKEIGKGSISEDLRFRIKKYLKQHSINHPVELYLRRSEESAYHLLTRFYLKPIFTILDYDKYGSMLISKIILQRQMELESKNMESFLYATSLVKNKLNFCKYLENPDPSSVYKKLQESPAPAPAPAPVPTPVPAPLVLDLSESESDSESDSESESELDSDSDSESDSKRDFTYIDGIFNEIKDDFDCRDLNIDNRIMKHLSEKEKFKRIKSVNLDGCLYLSRSGISYLLKMENVSSVDISNTNVDDEDIAILNDIKNLTELKLSGTNVNGNFGIFPNLVELFVDECHLNCEGFNNILYQQPSLKKVDISNSSLSGEMYEDKSSIEELIAINFKGRLNLNGFDNLIKLAANPSFIEELPSNIRVLELYNSSLENWEWDLPQLQILNLENCVLGTSIFERLAESKSLETISISSSKLTDEVVEKISSLKFPYLELISCDGFTGEGFKNLNLEKLVVYNCPVVNDQFVKLLSRNDLLSLNLSRSPKLTDAGLLHITDIESLMTLRVRDCPKITNDAIQKLKNAFPNLVIKI